MVICQDSQNSSLCSGVRFGGLGFGGQNFTPETLIRIKRGFFFGGEEMSAPRFVRCQKCGKPLGYVTVLARGLTSLVQPLRNAKVVAIYIECSQKEN
jgi:hypothetical protein